MKKKIKLRADTLLKIQGTGKCSGNKEINNKSKDYLGKIKEFEKNEKIIKTCFYSITLLQVN